jgi:hypothetical protein
MKILSFRVPFGCAAHITVYARSQYIIVYFIIFVNSLYYKFENKVIFVF